MLFWPLTNHLVDTSRQSLKMINSLQINTLLKITDLALGLKTCHKVKDPRK